MILSMKPVMFWEQKNRSNICNFRFDKIYRKIENSGSNYKVGDKLIFDNTNTSGSGLDVSVASVKGKRVF